MEADFTEVSSAAASKDAHIRDLEGQIEAARDAERLAVGEVASLRQELTLTRERSTCRWRARFATMSDLT